MRASGWVMVLALGAPLGLPGPSVGTSDATVAVANFSFAPATVNIAPGDSVTWHWTSGTHTVTEDAPGGDWCSVRTAPAPDCTRSFPTPGTFTYHCDVHPGSMLGTIVVVHPNAPDLAITNIALSDEGFTRHVDVTVTNLGVDAAPATQLRVTYGSDVHAQAIIGQVSVPALANGAVATVRVDWDTLGDVGDFTLIASADATGLVVELSESNNVMTKNSSVLVSGVPGIRVPV